MICCQSEPTLAQLLADPLVRTVMAADGVNRDELEAALRQVSRRLDTLPDAGEPVDLRA